MTEVPAAMAFFHSISDGFNPACATEVPERVNERVARKVHRVSDGGSGVPDEVSELLYDCE